MLPAGCTIPNIRLATPHANVDRGRCAAEVLKERADRSNDHSELLLEETLVPISIVSNLTFASRRLFAFASTRFFVTQPLCCRTSGRLELNIAINTGSDRQWSLTSLPLSLWLRRYVCMRKQLVDSCLLAIFDYMIDKDDLSVKGAEKKA